MKSEGSTRIPAPSLPDGGWAWMIVAGSFGINFLVMGILKSFGIIMVKFMEEYPGTSTASLMWIISLTFSFVFGLAPLTTGYTKFHGFRKEVFFGGILASIGFVSSSFVTSVVGLYLTIGFVVGIGFSMCWVPCLVIVGLYFDKKRASAVGITWSGSGMGAFVLPGLLQLLLDSYGLRGMLLIMGAIVLHICVGAALYRPLEDFATQRNRSEVTLLTEEFLTKPEGKEHLNEKEGLRVLHDTNDEVGEDQVCFITQCESNEKILNVEDVDLEDQEYVGRRGSSSKAACAPWLMGCVRGKSREPLLKFSLLKSYKMYVLMVSFMLMQYAYPMYYTFLPIKCSEIGISPDTTAILVSIPSIVEVFGRVSMGFIWDLDCVVKNMRRYNSYALGLLVSGTGIMITSLYKNSYWIAGTSVVMGWGSSMFMVSIPSVIVESFGVEDLVAASGFLFWIQSVPILTGGPLLGLIRDYTGTTDIPFYIMAACMLVGAVFLHFLMPVAERKESAKQKEDGE